MYLGCLPPIKTDRCYATEKLLSMVKNPLKKEQTIRQTNKQTDKQTLFRL
jgi:hypothetical protein